MDQRVVRNSSNNFTNDINTKGIPTTPVTRRSLRFMKQSSTSFKKAIATSAARRKERGKARSLDEALNPRRVHPGRPSTHSSSKKSASATSLQAVIAESKIVTLTPELGPKVVSDETLKQKLAGSNRAQGRTDFDVDG